MIAADTPIMGHRQISQRGLDLIKSFEGYHTKLPDGSCRAYLDKLAKPNVWTIGYGLTEGVYEGMCLSATDAEAALRRELSKHERAVDRLVTVDLNQHQFDALVSLSYNIGSGALGRSTLLKRLNAGDYKGAQAGFAAWKKAGGKVWPGLVRRRAAEADLFGLKPIVDGVPVEPLPIPDMPQIVEEVTVKEELAKSRKYQTAGWWAKICAFFGIGTPVTWQSIKATSETANEVAHTAGALVSSYGLVAVSGVLIVLAIVFSWFQQRQVQDLQEGRYTPSGAEE